MVRKCKYLVFERVSLAKIGLFQVGTFDINRFKDLAKLPMHPSLEMSHRATKLFLNDGWLLLCVIEIEILPAMRRNARLKGLLCACYSD